MRKLDVILDEIVEHNGRIVAAHFDAPVSWKGHFIPSSDQGWVRGSGAELARALMCFRGTPGARLGPSVHGSETLLRDAVNDAPNADTVFDHGWGIAVKPSAFTWERLEAPIIGFDYAGMSVYGPAPHTDVYTIPDLAHIDASDFMGDMRPKTQKARKSFMEKLETLWGGSSVLDALTNYPRTYRDLSASKPLSSVNEGLEDVVVFELASVVQTTTMRGIRMLIVKGHIPGTHEPFETAVFGDTREQENAIRFCAPGDKIIAFGRADIYNGHKSLKSPWLFPVDLFSTGLLPVYRSSTTKKVSAMQARKLTAAAINEFVRIGDPVPVHLLSKRRLMGRSDAFRNIHGPRDWSARGRARRRLAYDEFLRVSAVLDHARKESGHAVDAVSDDAVRASQTWMSQLPFPLTYDQKVCVMEIIRDLMSGRAMRRLIMGDVGTGKTVLAQIAAMMVLHDGGQVAVLAPTSVLASQLHRDFKAIGNAVLVSGSVSSASNRRKLAQIESGEAQIVVGTNSILSDQVLWNHLDLIIVDEQHKFGVEQRAKLLKDRAAHFLMMSATPIPATVASIQYGDMSTSIIQSLPAFRKPIVTEWIEDSGDNIVNDPRNPIWDDVQEVIESGGMVYVISSLVEESQERASVDTVYAALQKRFGNLVGKVHGRMKASEKTDALERFRRGETPVLVASSVVEVGVNVPDAVLEIVLDATRFGLASLHQLRGRVGRGDRGGRCVLVGAVSTSDPDLSRQRMQTLVKNSSGFMVAEEDLKLRGEGEFFGTSQSGRSDLGVASLSTDKELLEWAKEDYEGMDLGTKGILLAEARVLHPLSE